MTIHNRHVLTCSAIYATYLMAHTHRHRGERPPMSRRDTCRAAPCAARCTRRTPPTPRRLWRNTTATSAARRLDTCMRPQTGLPLVHDLNADGRRCRGPLPVLRDRQTFDSSRKCPAHMGSRGSSDIDHRCTHVSLTIGRMAHGRGWQRGTARQGRGGEAGGAPEKYSSKRLSAACKKSQRGRPS